MSGLSQPTSSTFIYFKKGQLLTCKNCNLVFYSPRAKSEELEEFYNSQDYRDYYQNSLMTGQDFSQKRYQQLHRLINNYNPKLFSGSPKHLLDIGCGSENFLSVANQNGWEVTGSESSSIAVQKANQMIGNKVLTGDILSLDLPENFYDLITIYHVIEHLIDFIST
jgi:2-polyprenyl-3-methyl-5-hydroxy-6-metoxy-1,4-benzoquinol methylase